MIDAHLHVWVTEPELYPWDPIGGYIPENPASIKHCLSVLNENQISKGVLVQPTPYGWDNAYLLDCKRMYPNIVKAVVLIDPFSENPDQVLTSLINRGADGIRINLHLNPMHIWKKSNVFVLFEACVEHLIPVCLQLTPAYFPFVEQLADSFPISFVIDHLGRPGLGTSLSDPDFQTLLQLSEKKNVYVKLSGMNYYSQCEAPYRDTWDLINAVKEQFGKDHCLWGSDFPFVEEHWTYQESIQCFRDEMGFSKDDLSWIFEKTALQIWWD